MNLNSEKLAITGSKIVGLFLRPAILYWIWPFLPHLYSDFPATIEYWPAFFLLWACRLFLPIISEDVTLGIWNAKKGGIQ